MKIGKVQEVKVRGNTRFMVSITTHTAEGKSRKRHYFPTHKEAQRFRLDTAGKAGELGERRQMPNSKELEEYFTAKALLPPELSLIDVVRAFVSGKVSGLGKSGVSFSTAIEKYWDMYLELGKVEKSGCIGLYRPLEGRR